MFDGEEVNEIEESKVKTIEEGTTCLADMSCHDEENKKTDEMELDVLNVAQLADNEECQITEHCSEENTYDQKDSATCQQQSSNSTLLGIAKGKVMENDGNGSAKQMVDENEKVSLLYVNFGM